MAEDLRPLVIKRKKVIAGGGHHGGAWKVAYADFVTAMMAFFLLMWLLNATTEEQRKGLADYFNPSIPVHRTSGGGDGPFGGTSVSSELTLAQKGTGATRERPSIESQARGETGTDSESESDAMLTEIAGALNALGGESAIADALLAHVRTRITDEGLVIEIFDLPDSPLFRADTAEPTQMLRNLMVLVAEVGNLAKNRIAVDGHLNATPLSGPDFAGWQLSTDRALRSRTLLAQTGVAQVRFDRVTGHADRAILHDDPFDIRNRRIEVTLLRDVAQ